MGSDRRAAGPPIPGVVIVWSGETPTLQALRLPSLGLILGRELLGPRATDDRISRQHARVRWNGTAFAITDLGSRNGTYVGGTLVAETEVTVTPPCVLRTGRTVSVLVADVRPYEEREVEVASDGVVGPRRAAAHASVREAAEAAGALLLVAEPGAGVDAAVSVFHAVSGGPLVEADAARLEGAAATRWWHGAGGEPPEVRRAQGGTLVVHDLAALDGVGQEALAGILRRGEPVEARVVAACDAEDVEALRTAVTGGGFRDDLWRQLQHRVDLPPLRACVEEIPHWVVQRVRDVAPDLMVHSTLIEACLLRPWPGNIDELRHEIAAAAALAREAGKRTVRGEHLESDAGMLLAMSTGPTTLAPGALETARFRRSRVKQVLDVPGVRAALEQHGGDLARAAIALGVHRNRLRRFIAEHGELAAHVVENDLYRTGSLDTEGEDR